MLTSRLLSPLFCRVGRVSSSVPFSSLSSDEYGDQDTAAEMKRKLLRQALGDSVPVSLHSGFKVST